MRTFVPIISLGLVAGVAIAASQQEEGRFLDAVRAAYSARNIDAITALHCWDGITAKQRADEAGALADQLQRENNVQSAQYTAPQASHSLTNNGIVYAPNLTPVKWIKIQFEPGPSSLRSLELEVGEKAGKLMLITYIPRKL